MKSKSTSTFSNNFLFAVCMNQSGMHPKNQLQHQKPNLKNLKKIHASKTLDKPVSMQDLHINRKHKFLKKPDVFQPFQETQPQPNPKPSHIDQLLTNSSHVPQNPSFRPNNLVQSQHSRRSGNKIKIFSNDNSKGSINVNDEKGKSMSRDSHGNSTSREKRGIQVTKTLLKRISGMYSTQDFGKNSQPTSNRFSHYQKNHPLKHQQDSFQNQTGFLMTTWDSQRTLEEYQLSRDYDSANNPTRNDNFNLSTHGVINILNNSYESSKTKDFPRHSFSYSNNQIAEYSMREGSRKSIEGNGMTPTNLGSKESVKKLENINFSKQNGFELPKEYRQDEMKRTSYHITIKPPQIKKNELTSSIQRGKMVTKQSQSKIFSSRNPAPNASTPQQKHSLTFSKSKQLPKLTTNILSMHALFQTAHEILSEQVSSIKQPYQCSQSNKQISGEELTNFLYGNKETNRTKLSSTMDLEEKEKYLVRYKNKTLEDMSVKQSMVEGYDHYYQ